jgi:hypothetical protein
MASYDRYSQFRQDGSISIVPFGVIPPKDTDFYEVYSKGKTRLDILSYQYYNDSNYGWLIMQANPQYGSIEFEIPDGANLRIPYPLSQSIQDYRASIEEYNRLYK